MWRGEIAGRDARLRRRDRPTRSCETGCFTSCKPPDLDDGSTVQPFAITGQFDVGERRVVRRGQEQPFFQSIDQQTAPPDDATDG